MNLNITISSGGLELSKKKGCDVMKELLVLLNESEKRQVEIDGLDMLEHILLEFHLDELTFEQYVKLRELEQKKECEQALWQIADAIAHI